jgi:hypothetical protein
MAKQDVPSDPRALKRELKRLAREEKMKKKELKREKKLKKIEKKKQRKEAILRAKLAKKGIKVPPKAETTPEGKLKGAATGQVQMTDAAGTAIPEAEIITEADKWTPKSARNLNDIQKMIDRMDHKGVKSLKERYKERYGEDLEVPDIYESKASLEVETAEQAGELEPITTSTVYPEAGATQQATPAKTGLFAKTPKPQKPKIQRELRLLDYRTPMYLRDKYGATGGKGKRIALAVVDIILNILLGIFIIKIITTIIYVMKDRKLEKQLSMMEQESAQPQPTS